MPRVYIHGHSKQVLAGYNQGSCIVGVCNPRHNREVCLLRVYNDQGSLAVDRSMPRVYIHSHSKQVLAGYNQGSCIVGVCNPRHNRKVCVLRVYNDQGILLSDPSFQILPYQLCFPLQSFLLFLLFLHSPNHTHVSDHVFLHDLLALTEAG